MLSAIILVILISIAGLSFSYSVLLFRMLTKIHRKIGDDAFYWLTEEKDYL